MTLQNKNKKEETIETYNKAAKHYAEKFNKLNRSHDIYEVFALNKTISPKVLEIGCGNGRDAKVISKYTKNYLGIDLSSEFIKLAEAENPKLKFIVADMEDYEFEEKLDIVFAFASFLHLDKSTFQKVLEKLHKKLNTGGLVKISIKYAEEYQEVNKRDEFGNRIFYFYCEQDIKDITNGYVFLQDKKVDMLGQTWLEVILRKE